MAETAIRIHMTKALGSWIHRHMIALLLLRSRLTQHWDRAMAMPCTHCLHEVGSSSQVRNQRGQGLVLSCQGCGAGLR